MYYRTSLDAWGVKSTMLVRFFLPVTKAPLLKKITFILFMEYYSVLRRLTFGIVFFVNSFPFAFIYYRHRFLTIAMLSSICVKDTVVRYNSMEIIFGIRILPKINNSEAYR